MGSGPPAAALAYARRLLAPLAVEPACRLVGLYLHSSAVLGGFRPAGSDVDLLGVLAEPRCAGRSGRHVEVGEDAARFVAGVRDRLADLLASPP